MGALTYLALRWVFLSDSRFSSRLEILVGMMGTPENGLASVLMLVCHLPPFISLATLRDP